MTRGMRRLMRAKKAEVIIGVDLAKGDQTTVHALKRGDVTTITSVTETKRNKYGAMATHVNGIRFDSKREARYYEELCLRVAAGEVRYFLRQVPLHLPGGTRLVVDFMEVMATGQIRYVDVKGRETPAFKIKRREIEAIYPIRILLA
jgi:hypothetical protein